MTSYLNNILPWKRVHEVELWDTAVADGKMFAYCCTNGCTLLGDLDQPPAFGNRLKTFRRSILLTRIQECDEGLEILVKVQWRASLHKLAPRSYTLRIRLRPNQDKGNSVQLLWLALISFQVAFKPQSETCASLACLLGLCLSTRLTCSCKALEEAIHTGSN